MSDHALTLGKWTSSTLLGWIAAIPLVAFLAAIGERIGFGGARTWVALGVGAGFAIAQSLSNQQTPVGSLRWVWLSAIGLAIPALVVDVARLAPITNPYALHICIALGGLTVGIAQMLFLRKYFANAAIWVPASVLGWATLSIGSASADLMLSRHNVTGIVGAGAYLLLIGAGAAGLGAITGFAIERLRPSVS